MAVGHEQNAVIDLARDGFQTLGTKYFCISLALLSLQKVPRFRGSNLWGQTMLEILIQKESLYDYVVSRRQSSVKRIVRLNLSRNRRGFRCIANFSFVRLIYLGTS